MLWDVLPYLFLLVVIGSAGVLLTSRKISERFVMAGILPRSFLGLLPVIQTITRVFGAVLIAGGLLKIAIDTGWINAMVLSRYAFPGTVILLGLVLLVLSRD